jgi:hypothetical protein
MATRGGNVRVKFGADTSDLDRGARKGERSLDRFEKSGSRSLGRFSANADKSHRTSSKAFAGIARGLAGPIAAVASLGAAAAALKSSVATVETLAKGTAQLSRATGLDNTTASEWVSITKVRGIEAKQLTIGFVSLARNMKAAAAGSKASADAFKELGVSQEAIKRGDAPAVLRQVSDAFSKLPDGANKAALAQRLFGKQAQTLLPLLNDGSKALKEQLGLAKTYGATLDKGGTESALKAVAAQRELKLAWTGVQVVLGTKVVPALTAAARAVANFVADVRNGTSGAGRAARTLGEAYVKYLGWLRGALQDTIAFVKRFADRNRESIQDVVHAFRNVARAAQFAFEEVMLPVIRKVIQRVLPIIQSLRDTLSGLVRFVSAILTGQWGKAWDAAKDVVVGQLRTIKNMIVGYADIFFTVVKSLGKVIIKGLVAGLSGLGRAIKNAIVDGVKSGVSAAGNAVTDAIGSLNPFGDGIGKLAKKVGDGAGRIGASMGAPGLGGGALMGADPDLGPFAGIGSRFGLHVSSGLRVGAITSSGNKSYHSSGDAIDEAGPAAGMLSYFRFLKKNFGARLRELIFTPGGAGIKDGRPFTYTGQVAADHFDHVHVAYTGPFGDGIGQAAQAAKAAGFRGQALINAVAIAGAESRYDAEAKNLVPPDHSIGMWQINQLAHHGRYGSDSALENPFTNARAAFAISGGGRSFGPWSTWPSAAASWTARARAAVAGLTGTGGKGGGGAGAGSAGKVAVGKAGRGVSGTPAAGLGLGESRGGFTVTSTGFEGDLAATGVKRAKAEARDDLPGLIKAMADERKIKRRRLRVIRKVLKTRIAQGRRTRLEQEEAQLIGEVAVLTEGIKEYKADARGGATTITRADELDAGVDTSATDTSAGGDTGGGAPAAAEPDPNLALLVQLKQEELEVARRTEALIRTQQPSLMNALAAMLSGNLGGPIGLGFSTPGYPGGGVRY